MKILSSLSDLRAVRASLPGSFGLVPTMGALHDGHLSLVRRAKAECAHVGVSIFVNPTQFGPGEDLSKYPRDLDRDLKLLELLDVDVVWTPAPEVVYPPAFQTWVTVEQVSAPLEGKHRPGHFRGVATVVAKLLNAFTPDKAYFGQKDAQQVVVIKQMVRDLNFPLEIVVCPIVREPDGLAMSSRNVSLNPEERKAATVLYCALSAAKAKYDAGERDAEMLRAAMSSTIAAEPLAREEYVSAADPDTLTELERIDKGVLLSMAVRLGKTRLIDNFLLP
ncbi:MAG: pantoate--beta-alanine ligase [Chloroflexi bacterium RBG_16_63_12]|nr:MAG: pantoate--beta-alanine ligase [Chloroflexi bacterium RBG_16_63_12]